MLYRPANDQGIHCQCFLIDFDYSMRLDQNDKDDKEADNKDNGEADDKDNDDHNDHKYDRGKENDFVAH
jgi:hypothetical protein